MNNVEKMRGFIIKFLFIGIWAGIIYGALKYALPLFMPFVIAFVIAFLLKTPINWLSKKLHIGRRPVAVVVLILAYVVVGTLLTLAGSRLVVQVSVWFAELPRLYRAYIEPAAADVSHWLDEFSGGLSPAVAAFFAAASESLSRSVSGLISSISSGAISFLSSLATRVPLFLVGLFLVIIASFFLVVDYYKVTAFLLGQLSAKAQHRLALVRDFAINVLWKFGRAYFILLSLTFVEVSVGLLILRVPNAFLIAFFTAILDILPVLGTGAIMVPWMLYSFFTGNIGLGVGLAILYGFIAVVRQIVEPRVVGRQIGLYPLLTLVSMFIGARLFGFWGLLGLPITLTVLIHLNRAGEIAIFKEPRPAVPAPAEAPSDGKSGPS